MALQGIDGALPVLHGAQGCSFLGKVLLTKHFREPIALASSKLFVEEAVMGSEEKLAKTIEGFVEKNNPALIGVLTSGLTEVKGDDVARIVKELKNRSPQSAIIHVPTPDYDGGLEKGYARAIETIVSSWEFQVSSSEAKQINILAGSHLTPADVAEIRELVESFGMKAIILPDLSALDGSRQSISPLARGGTTRDELKGMDASRLTLAIGPGMERSARLLKERCSVGYEVFDSIAGLAASDHLMKILKDVSGGPLPSKYERRRAVLRDGMRDAHFFFGGKRICLALEPDLSVQTSEWLDEMGASVELAVVPTLSDAVDRIRSKEVRIGDLFSIEGDFDLLISNSHAESTAKRLGVPLYEIGFPVYKTLGYTSKVTTGYQGTLTMIHDAANFLMKKH
jgi:nitrogenase molybdenum-iron cofactor biosynthesis protein NifN